MDFYKIRTKKVKEVEYIYPDWTANRSKDLMVRGHSFYAIWDEKKNIWSTDEYDVPRLVDEDLFNYNKEHTDRYSVMTMEDYGTGILNSFRRFVRDVGDNSHPLDESLIFANTEVKKSDYSSRRLPYSLEAGSFDAWDELMGVLYSPDERDKIEWAIGSVISGDSKRLQKFFVFYGPAGSGKSTVLNIISKMFDGYCATFDARALGSSNGAFATEVFRSNPLVAIQHDGDLSKIEDNTKLNSIISHEEMTMNEKYKSSYSAHVNALLFMGTNRPVKISDAKSGILRRLIDVHPTGAKIEPDRYNVLISQVDFELGAVAHHCFERYKALGKNYYNHYRPIEMMLQTDVFYNYVEYAFDIFKKDKGVTLKQAYSLYKEFCSETGIDRILPQYKFREELRNYFKKFEDKVEIDGETMRSYYSGFKGLEKYQPSPFIPDDTYSITWGDGHSILDDIYADQPAQYAKESGFPGKKWVDVKTTLAKLDTTKLHFVKVPENHIVIDFDLVDEAGEKDLARNLEEASKWPPTYTETSKSGQGIHLHYIYGGNVKELSSVFDVGIEIKTLLGDASLRRKLTKCNNLEIATITSGLPKKEKPMLDSKAIQSEKSLRNLIERNLRKEIHPGTKSSVDFIHKILEEAYDGGLSYDVRDMRGRILTFALSSTHQSQAAVKAVKSMRFVGQDAMPDPETLSDEPVVFYDVEVYPNLFVICWKYAGENNTVNVMINPEPHEIEKLFKLRLIGFNNRRYDNHILYARFLEYSNEELYRLSSRIINTKDQVLFAEAYNLSYADIYDFSSKKQGLKKFQIELGIHHMELDIPWDQPVDEKDWPRVVEYCSNDVISTEKVFEARKEDFTAREILASLSGMSVNHSTQSHTAKIIFGDDKYPQKQFIYTDLSKEFPGYKYEGKESFYRGEVTGEGGYVYSEPGIYEDVALLDVASMHPTSIEILNLFGPYTKRYSELKEARLAIKRKDYKEARTLLGGKLSEFLTNAEKDPDGAEALSYALKIVINIVYGLTSAGFENAFRDNRNKDNIVAKRGALFMIDLKHAVQEKGFSVVHIKTDSIKIPNATQEIIDFVFEFGKKYGYDFEHENTYDKFCLVNDAVYIARTEGFWNAVGAQFQHPYVYKKLFTNEELTFDDYCETRSVTQGVMYLNFGSSDEATLADYMHVGRTGSFVPVLEGGGELLRVKDDKQFAVTGTKGYRWVEREVVLAQGKPIEELVDFSYFEKMANDAKQAIENYGSYEEFIN